MFAISFDMSVSDLEKHYGKPYNRAYFEIKDLMRKTALIGFKAAPTSRRAMI